MLKDIMNKCEREHFYVIAAYAAIGFLVYIVYGAPF